jgi:hypothetical protein
MGDTRRDPSLKGMEHPHIVDYGAKLDNYSWDQTRDTVSLTITRAQLNKAAGFEPDKPLRAKGLDVTIGLHDFKIVMKENKAVILEGKFPTRITMDDSTWYWDGDSDALEASFAKDFSVIPDAEEPWWPSLLVGQPEIDVEFIKASKHLDISLLRKVKAAKLEKEKAGGEAAAA